VFVKKRRRQPKPHVLAQREEQENQSLEVALSKRGVGPAAAAELVTTHPRERIETMLQLHDWHNARGQQRGPGFIVAGIRSTEPYCLPKGFRSSQQTARNSRNRPVREKPKQTRRKAVRRQKSELKLFLAFWGQLDAQAQAEIEAQALAQADPIKRRWYEDARNGGRDTAEYFRLAILNDHFRRTHPVKPGNKRLLKA
jgi:hypothetical protein